MMSGCDDCSVYGTGVKDRPRWGATLCDKCSKGRRMDELSPEGIADEFDVGDEIGAFTIVLEGKEFTRTINDGDGGFKEVGSLRRPGVYLPKKEVRGGTAVQRSEPLLRQVSDRLRSVAEAAEDEGYTVEGAGKSHDGDIYVFIDSSEYDTRDPRFYGTSFIERTSFTGCTLMGFRLGWWEHKEPVATIQYTEEFEERGMPAAA